jgi:hypothetical protein
MTRYIAVIGTAGRDRSPLLTKDLWRAMRRDLASRISVDDVLVSGGAAWADHLAVDAFLGGRCGGLELYLPAPLFHGGGITRFMGERGSSGAASNYYHGNFSRAVGIDSRAQIMQAMEQGAIVVQERVARGYAAMFNRNAKVATRCTEMIAYTFGDGSEPEDGGTRHTWNLAGQRSAERLHVPLRSLITDL